MHSKQFQNGVISQDGCRKDLIFQVLSQKYKHVFHINYLFLVKILLHFSTPTKMIVFVPETNKQTKNANTYSVHETHYME